MKPAPQNFGDTYRYIQGVDGLRAIAVLAVMFFHIDPIFLPGGFSGVDIFFVISGYVVSSSLARESIDSFFRFTINFYARRVVRIFPALILCLVVVSIVTTLFIPSSWLSQTNYKTALAAFFGVSNFALILYTDGYFSPRVEFNPFTHTWSLGVEEQFYVVFPLVMFIWLKFRERKGILGFIANWLLASLLVVSLFYSWFETSASPDKAFYLLPSRFWELACGALLFKLHSKSKLLPKTTFDQKACLLLGAFLVAMGLIFSDDKSFPFPWALLSVVGTLFLICGVFESKSAGKPLIQCILENSIMVRIGKISFSLYLWHWPVYVIFRWTVGLQTIVEIVCAIVLTLLFASISYQFVERPFRNKKLIIGRPSWKIVSTGVVVIILSFGFTGLVFLSQSTISLSTTKDKAIWYPAAWETDSQQRDEKMFIERKLFVLGDSHAGAYSTMFQQLSEDIGIRVYQYSAAGCGIASLLRPGMSKSEKCAVSIENSISQIEKLALPGDILFLASLRANRLGDQWETFSDELVNDKQLGEEAIHSRELALNETANLIARFQKKSLHIVMDAPKPVFRSPPFRCSDWFNKTNPICAGGFTLTRDYLLEHRKPAMLSLYHLASEFSELIVWDPFPILCETRICSAFDHDKPLFFDGDHLSAHGNHVLYPSFRALIEKTLGFNNS